MYITKDTNLDSQMLLSDSIMTLKGLELNNDKKKKVSSVLTYHRITK